MKKYVPAIIFTVMFLALFGFLTLLYNTEVEYRQTHRQCPCEMVKNKECPEP